MEINITNELKRFTEIFQIEIKRLNGGVLQVCYHRQFEDEMSITANLLSLILLGNPNMEISTTIFFPDKGILICMREK